MVKNNGAVLDLLKRYPDGSIVRARVTPVRGSIHLRNLHQLINGCVEGLALEGDYASCLVCEEEATEIRCAFAVHADAAEFARSIGADGGESGWAFDLDASKEIGLAGHLDKQKGGLESPA
jgi:hypothetical protein